MSLATRCPACGTVFRVVRDQLKVSEGWVRCGRCSEVFNGGQRLFELEAGAPTDAPRSAETAPPAMARVGTAFAPQVAVPPTPPTEPARPAQPAPGPASPPGSVSITGPWAPSAASAVEATQLAATPPVTHVDASPETAEEAARQDLAADAVPAMIEASSASASAAPPVGDAVPTAADSAFAGPAAEPVAEPVLYPGAPLVTPVAEPVAAVAGSAAEPEADAAAEPQAAPGFVRRAERAARWRSPRRRAALGMLALLLALLLAGQIGLNYRDHVAARWPATLPWLESACAALGCRVEPPRYVDALNVDSSGLVRLPDSALYQLSLVVQNRAATLVRMPAVDLTLTDLQGQIMARRVLTAVELGQSTDRVPAHGEVALKATLDLGDRSVAGYTIELFYP